MQRDFQVGDKTARPSLRQIEGPDGTEPVEVKSMEVFVELALHAGEVRTRQQLLDAVWGHAFVSEDVLSHCIWDLRRALGDNARRPQFIQTVPKQGYRLIAPVSWLTAGPGENERYTLLEELGRGSMGVVWKAEDTLLHRRVALKFLPPEWSREPDAKTRFLKEARIAAGLDHPNICPLHELGETGDGRLFLVLPYYAGGTLKARMGGGPLPWREAVSIAAAVARGLVAAHGAGVIHRDIKPANLLFPASSVPGEPSAAGAIKILDFGIARLSDETQRTLEHSSSAGTPAYKSPEQTLGDAVDSRTDLWSLGVMLYEMLAGRRPFRGEYETALIDAILHREPEPLGEVVPDLPEALTRVVDQLLKKDADERYAEAQSVVEDLERILDHRPTEGTSGPEIGAPVEMQAALTDSPPMEGAVRQPRVPTRVLLAASAVLILGAVFWTWQKASQPSLIRVIVAAPEISVPDDEELRFAASGVLFANLETLLAFDDLAVLEPGEAAEAERSIPAMVRAAGADEVLVSHIERRNRTARVTLKRIDGRDSRILWTTSFEAPIGSISGHLLADRVHSRLVQAYPTRQRGTGTFDIRDDDFRAYLDIFRNHYQDGQRLTEADLERLAAILETSPRFIPAIELLAKRTAILARDSRRPDLVDAIRQRLQPLLALAPSDHRLLNSLFEIERAVGRDEEAAAVLERLEQAMPLDHPMPFELRAYWLRDQGRLDEAILAAETAIERHRSWRNLFLLADIEYRNGNIEASRSYLEELLQRVPGSSYGLAKLAELELLYGDLKASAEHYRALAERFDRRTYWTNLGTTAYLQSDFESARESYLNALERAPEHPVVLSNLADAETALGLFAEAQQRCRKVLEVLDRPDGQEPKDRILIARCLARLEQHQAAVVAVQEALRFGAQDAEIIYQAAVVYALVGERTSALVNARRALDLGVNPRWFRVPELQALQDDPVFLNH